jgi:hypothetical protein
MIIPDTKYAHARDKRTKECCGEYSIKKEVVEAVVMVRLSTKRLPPRRPTGEWWTMDAP